MLVEQEIIKKQQPFKITKIDNQRIKENKSVMNKIQNINSKKNKSESNTQNKIIYSNQYDFGITTDNATYIENLDGSYHSYTFPIFRNEDNGLLENLLLSLQQDGSYKAFIVSYDLTEQEIEDLNNGLQVNLQNRTTTSLIDDIELSSNIMDKMSAQCIWVHTSWCSYGNHPGGYEENGDACPGYESTTGVYCPDSGGGDGSSAGTGGTGNNSDGTNDNCNTCGSSGGSSGTPNPDITTPTYCKICPELDDLDEYCTTTNALVNLTTSLNLTPNALSCLESSNCEQVTALDDYITNNPNESEFAALAAEAICAEGEVDFVNEIIKDSTFIGTTAECVLDRLISTENNLFKQTSEAFTNNNSKYKIKFVVANIPYAGVEATTALPDDNGIIIITINDGSANGNAIDLAASILHETIHAELHRIILTNNDPPNSISTERYNWYVKMWNYYENLNYTNNEVATFSEHNLMAYYYINPIANGLRQYDNYSQVVSNYMAFSWTGLHHYGIQSQIVTQTQLNNYGNLAQNIYNDNYTNPCDE